LVNDQRDEQIPFYVFISIYNSLHVWSISCSSSGETICINTASGNSLSMLVAEMCSCWKNDQRDAQILFYVFISIYNSLHVWSISCSSSGETICINTALVTVFLCWWLRCVQVAHISATNIEWLLPEAVLIQFVPPDDEHDVLETCREL